MTARIITIATAIALIASGPAGAQVSQDAARRQSDRGQALYHDGKYREARAAFSAAFDASGLAAFVFNMAECSRLAGDVELAREQYEKFLSLDPDAKLAGLARQRLAALRPAAASSTSTPPPSPVAPANDPGPARPGDGSVSPGAPPGATSPFRPSAPLRASAPPAELPPRGDAEVPSPGYTRRAVGIALVGAGIAGLATGLWFGHRASSLSDRVTTACERSCDWGQQRGTYDQARTAQTSQILFMGLGAGAIVAGGVVYWLGFREARSSRLSLAWRDDGAMIGWDGAW